MSLYIVSTRRIKGFTQVLEKHFTICLSKYFIQRSAKEKHTAETGGLFQVEKWASSQLFRV